jgi:MFS family permease
MGQFGAQIRELGGARAALVRRLPRPPVLDARQWRVLGLVSLAALFGQYDQAIFGLALPQIQSDLGISEQSLGLLGSLVRAGALPAFLLGFAADRVGRRPALLVTIVAYTLLTGATALAPDTASFVALQFLASGFAAAELLLGVVVLTEELDPGARGFGIGAMFTIKSLGVGLAAALFPLCAGSPGAWRSLYAVGLVPLAALAWWRRTLPETARFRAARERRASAMAAVSAGPLASISALVRAQPRRAAAMAAVVLLFAGGGAAGDFLAPKYLQDHHHWTPGQLSLLFLLAGPLALAGSFGAGWLSDRLGRKPTAIALAVAVVVCAIGFFQAGPTWLAPLWIATIAALVGCEVVYATYGAELFPTAQRATAVGLRSVMATLGGVAGLAAEAALYSVLHSHWTSVCVLMLFALGAPAIVAASFPETAGRTLEEIAPDPEGGTE